MKREQRRAHQRRAQQRQRDAAERREPVRAREAAASAPRRRAGSARPREQVEYTYMEYAWIGVPLAFVFERYDFPAAAYWARSSHCRP